MILCITIELVSLFRKVSYSEFQCFLPLPQGETLKFRIIQRISFLPSDRLLGI